MKKHLCSGLAMVMIVLSAMFVIAGCGGGGSTPTPQTSPDEYVKITYDGTDYTFKNGLSTQDGTVIGAKAVGFNSSCIVSSASPVTSYTDFQTISGCLIFFGGITSGTYDVNHNSVTLFLGQTRLNVECTITVNQYGAVGGEIEGTISGTATPKDGSSKTVTGSFKVIRSADGALDSFVPQG